MKMVNLSRRYNNYKYTHTYIHTPNEKHNGAKYDEAKMDKTEEIDISKYNRLPLTPHFQ